MSLQGKIALVTGASRGIGFATAKALSQAGATVIGTATSDANVAKLNKNFEQLSMNAHAHTLNVSDNDSIDALAKHILADHGAVDILVNNAAITKDNLFLRMKPDEWHACIDTNLNALYYITKAFIKPMMKARWGRIINLSSVVAYMGNPGQTNYAAAKAGMLGFSKSLAKEFASRDITVNMVVPGFIDTDMTDVLPDTQKEHLLASIPVARLGKPEDVASAVSFLASMEAGYITGEAIHVNGGMHMA